MRRVLFVAVLVTMLLGIGSVAFADEPKTDGLAPIYTPYKWSQLGQVWWFFAGGFFPGERVDAWMYRPATAAWNVLTQQWVSGPWPLKSDIGPEGPNWGTWWWGRSVGPANVNDYIAPPEDPFALFQTNASAFRRMNLTAKCDDVADPGCQDPVYLFADSFGYYYVEFMQSRDEVWFPCSFPLKWKCNFWADEFTYVFHSPDLMTYECLGPFECLSWPKDPVMNAVLDPRDTVSPLEVHIQGELYDFGSAYYIFPFEVRGMSWKWQDIDF